MKKVKITIEISEKLRERFKKKCKKEGVSQTDKVNNLLKQFLKS